MPNDVETYHASAKKVGIEELLRQKKAFEDFPQLTFFLDTVPTVYFILNEDRQIVFANKVALATLGFENVDSILGMRVGEALNCQHANELLGGCGTSETCKYCGAVNAMISGLNNKSDIQECRITSEHGSATYDFRVWSNPYDVEGEKFVIFSVSDIGDEKRRRALEGIFFHDVLNTAGGIKGISSLIMDYPEEVDEFKDILFASSNHLINEIKAQRDLMNAENNELKIQVRKMNSTSVLNFLIGIYSNHEVAKDKILKLSDNVVDIDFTSDEALLLRVVSNMTKNALEASTFAQEVTIGCTLSGDQTIKFAIHSQNYIPRKIQLQIFQRSFSTKGFNRGLGTYSMKLLSERYLNGKVYFVTDEETGTTFFAEYPISLPDPETELAF